MLQLSLGACPRMVTAFHTMDLWPLLCTSNYMLSLRDDAGHTARRASLSLRIDVVLLQVQVGDGIPSLGCVASHVRVR